MNEKDFSILNNKMQFQHPKHQKLCYIQDAKPKEIYQLVAIVNSYIRDATYLFINSSSPLSI